MVDLGIEKFVENVCGSVKRNENNDQDDENLLDLFKLLYCGFSLLLVVRLHTYIAQLQSVISSDYFAHK